MNDVKTCSGDLNSGISTNFFSVFRFILNLEKDIVKQNTCYVSGVYLFFIFHDPAALTHHLRDSDIYFLFPSSIHLFTMVVEPGCVCAGGILDLQYSLGTDKSHCLFGCNLKMHIPAPHCSNR